MTYVRKSYPIGSRVRVRAVFRDENEALVDPTRVTFQYRTPEGVDSRLTLADGQVTRESIGRYFVWLSLEQQPRYLCRYTGSGNYRGTTGDFYINVDPSAFSRVQ
jgi:hypothetical protein